MQVVSQSALAILLECGERDVDCQTGNGANYRGLASVTISGDQCKDWDKGDRDEESTKWYKENVGSNLPKNLCRDPDPKTSSGVWCYNSEDFKTIDYCAVRYCSYCDKGG